MKTSPKQTSLFGEEKLTSSQVDSLANRTVTQEVDLERKMTATSGRKCLERFEKFSQVGLWEKTFVGLLVGMKGWSSKRCKLTWKMKGTKYNRFYFQLAPSELPTEGIEFGLLPTVTTDSVNNRKKKYNQGGKPLSMVINQLIPTPMATDYKGGRTTEALKKSGRSENNNLQDFFHQPGKTSQLSPLFVAEMMGFPPNWTTLPFQNGEVNQSKDSETQ